MAHNWSLDKSIVKILRRKKNSDIEIERDSPNGNQIIVSAYLLESSLGNSQWIESDWLQPISNTTGNVGVVDGGAA